MNYCSIFVRYLELYGKNEKLGMDIGFSRSIVFLRTKA